MISESEVERNVTPCARELVVELDGVDQVAVVGQRDRAAVVPVDRLGVLPAAVAGGRVAHVADRHLAGERLQAALVEDLGDEPEVALGGDVAVARRWRCRPTPGRGAVARTGRSTRAGRRPARARRPRTLRTRRAVRRARQRRSVGRILERTRALSAPRRGECSHDTLFARPESKRSPASSTEMSSLAAGAAKSTARPPT